MLWKSETKCEKETKYEKKNKLVKQLILRGRTLGFWGRGVEMSRWDTGTRPTILDKIEGNSNPPLTHQG